jgi:4-amino-4-deoxy-L-arabinose transferase-like glycosyltransferase
MMTHGDKWLSAAAVLMFTTLWFAQLGGRALFDPDEGRYAEIPREMLAGGDWVIPHLDGLAYLEKPPLQYWATALAFAAFGQSEAAARSFTGLCGFLSLAIVFLIGRRVWGVAAGARAALFTAASTLFTLLGHQLTLDMALCFLLLLCLGCFVQAQLQAQARARSLWMLGVWVAAALAVLTKGLIGALIPAATLTVYALWQRDLKIFARLNAAWGLVLFTAIAAPWFVLAARANPDFLRFFFIREHVERFLTPVEHRTEAWWFFIAVLAGAVLAWLPQALVALARGWRASVPRGDFDARRLLWIWSVFVVVFFSLSDSKLIPYILPAIPTLALLAAGQPERRGGLSAASLLSAAAGAGVLVYASGAAALALRLAPVIVWTGAVLLATAAASALLTLKGRLIAASSVQCAGWILAAATVLAAARLAEPLYSGKQLGLVLREALPEAAPVFAVECYGQSLTFYARRTAVLVHYRDELDLGLRQDPARGIASLEEFAARWRDLPAGFALMPLGIRDQLAATGLPMHELARSADRVLVAR